MAIFYKACESFLFSSHSIDYYILSEIKYWKEDFKKSSFDYCLIFDSCFIFGTILCKYSVWKSWVFYSTIGAKNQMLVFFFLLLFDWKSTNLFYFIFIFILFYFIFLAFKDILLSISYDAGFIEKILDNFVNKFPISLLRLNNEEIALQLL